MVNGCDSVRVAAAAVFLLRACLAGQHWVGTGERVRAWQGGGAADRLRLGVRDEGVYRVSAGEIAAAAGAEEAAVAAALEAGGVSLTCGGRQVAWTAYDGALYFYGEATREFFAPENVYWLAFGAGERMAAEAAFPAEGAGTNGWFMCERRYRGSFVAPYHYRDRRSTNGTLTNVLNFGEWVPSSADEATRRQVRTLAVPGYALGAETGMTVRVELASYRDFTTPDTHACEVLVNGVSCGTNGWSGEQAVAFDYAVPPGTVAGESLALTVRNAGGTTFVSDFMILDVALVYPRRYEAEDGLVLCAGGTEGTAAAGGFGTDALAAWRVTEAGRPVELEAAVAADGAGGWQAVFACGGEGERYAVFAVPEGCYAPSVSGVRDVDWFAEGEMPELAIVTPPRRWVAGFEEAVGPLAAFREAQGLRTRVVDAEEIYNAFNHGVAHPEAFRRFCAAGVTNAAGQALRYLLFAGHGGTDYKLDALPLGDERAPAYFPLYLGGQVEASLSQAIMVPRDMELGDVVGGGIPEVAVGRFTATNAVSLAQMVAKTIRYEQSAAWKRNAVFTADWQNEGAKYFNFSGVASNTAAGFAAAGWQARGFYAWGSKNVRPFWNDTFTGTGAKVALNEGAGLFYYLGHSNDMLAGATTDDRLFNLADLREAQWGFAPVALLMGCRMGRWTLLNFQEAGRQCLADAGLCMPHSGFTAVVSAAGYMQFDHAREFSYAFRDRVAAGAVRLGDAWVGAFAALGDVGASRLWHMTLLGDPSLCIRMDRTARGTSAEWLMAQGLGGDPYADLLDQDGDGFATWVEAQAGTDPLRGGLRMRGLRLPTAAEAGGAVSLNFEPLAGGRYRLETTDDLARGEWVPSVWREAGAAGWSAGTVEGDWPLKSLELPFTMGEQQRYYRISSE